MLPNSLIRCTRDFGAVPIQEIEDQRSAFRKSNERLRSAARTKALQPGAATQAHTPLKARPSCRKMINFLSNGGHRRANPRHAGPPY